MVSWIHVFNELDVWNDPSNTIPLPYYGHGKLDGARFSNALHLVREPLNSITSLSCSVLKNTHRMKRNGTMSMQFRNFVERHVGIPANDTQVNLFKAGMEMWLEWHRFLDGLCIDRIRLEDLFDPNTTLFVLDHVFTKVNKTLPPLKLIGKALAKTGRKTNSRRHRKVVSWNELFSVNAGLAQQVFDLASSYGYDFGIDPAQAWRDAPSRKLPVC